jgi:metal-responsive CopG/Arc/MetJ family transcriptional regulator
MAKKQHGGKREGAGRKPSPEGPAVAVTVTVPEPLMARLDTLAEQNAWSRSEAVKRAIQSLLGDQRRSAKA